MRKCIATVSISGTLPAKPDAIATARREVFENDLITFPGTPRDLRRMAADHGLGIDLHPPFRALDAGVQRVWHDGYGALNAALRLAPPAPRTETSPT